VPAFKMLAIKMYCFVNVCNVESDMSRLQSAAQANGATSLLPPMLVRLQYGTKKSTCETNFCRCSKC